MSCVAIDVLVISNALGAARMNDPNASNPAFTEAESDAVRDWVNGGGALLLIADHAPMGSANQILGQRFGVDMSKMYTVDPQNSDPQNPGFIIYTRESGRLADHPVTRGRNASEQVNKVIAFTGQSLKGPADSVAFMKLADTAMDAMPGQNPQSRVGRRTFTGHCDEGWQRARDCVGRGGYVVGSGGGRAASQVWHEPARHRQPATRTQHHALAVGETGIRLVVSEQ